MKKKIIVLGAGLVGRAIARDLSQDFDVTSADISENALSLIKPHVKAVLPLDFSKPEAIRKAVTPYDLVIGAVPGFLGFAVVKSVIEAGKDMVDISFFPEDSLELNDLAKKQDVTIVTDCGVAPGMGNIFLGYHNQTMVVHSFTCYVGGLPVVRDWPFEYKAVFSPADVIEEYVRTARFVQNGVLVTREALSDAELLQFPEVGTLEAWNSDGLRSLLTTMSHIPNMIEKTLRYPGTVDYLRVLRDCGFFSSEEIDVNGVKIRPLDVTSTLLFPKWSLNPGDEEFTVMRIIIEGIEKGKDVTYTYNLLDRTDRETGIHSMARTTGYTCTAVANLVISKQFDRKGICPPEFVGEKTSNFNYVIEYLRERGVHYNLTGGDA